MGTHCIEIKEDEAVCLTGTTAGEANEEAIAAVDSEAATAIKSTFLSSKPLKLILQGNGKQVPLNGR